MPEERLAFLKREEIRTMAKDLARLREEEAQREKERISQLRLEEKVKKETLERERIVSTMIPKEIREKEERTPIPTAQPPPPAPKAWEKVLVRIVLLLGLGLFLTAIGFGYWFFKIKKGEPTTSPSPQPASPSPTPLLSPSPLVEEPAIPGSRLPLPKTKILWLSETNHLTELLAQTTQAVEEEMKIGEFLQLVVRKENRFLGFRDFAQSLGIKTPAGLLERVEQSAEDFTLFAYAQKEGMRLGFLVRLTEGQDSHQLLRAWEATIETDLENFLIPLKPEGSLPTKIFRQARYQNIAFRYLSLSKNNLGICWAIIDNQLILTSSGETMIKVIDLLKTK